MMYVECKEHIYIFVRTKMLRSCRSVGWWRLLTSRGRYFDGIKSIKKQLMALNLFTTPNRRMRITFNILYALREIYKDTTKILEVMAPKGHFQFSSNDKTLLTIEYLAHLYTWEEWNPRNHLLDVPNWVLNYVCTWIMYLNHLLMAELLC